jgi:hypothetical protein
MQMETVMDIGYRTDWYDSYTCDHLNDRAPHSSINFITDYSESSELLQII